MFRLVGDSCARQEQKSRSQLNKTSVLKLIPVSRCCVMSDTWQTSLIRTLVWSMPDGSPGARTHARSPLRRSYGGIRRHSCCPRRSILTLIDLLSCSPCFFGGGGRRARRKAMSCFFVFFPHAPKLQPAQRFYACVCALLNVCGS